jgi:hypothetical protein
VGENEVPNRLESVTLWTNAFIPANVPGLTKPVAAGPHRGKTMITGPVFSESYLTDNRSYDSKWGASSRGRARATIKLATAELSGIQVVCDVTHEIHSTTGAEICAKAGDAKRIKFGAASNNGGIVRVDFAGEANNPCYAGSPDIEWSGSVTINSATGKLRFKGSTGLFPSFEMYAARPGGPPVKVFQVDAKSGSAGPWWLWLGEWRPIDVEVQL